MRRILWTCILAAQLAAQTATTITGSFVSATGAAQTGYCTFTPSQASSVAGPYYVTGPAARCSIVAGALVGANGTGVCALMPTDGLLARPYWMECWIDQRNLAGAIVRSVSQGRAQANVSTSATPLDIEDLVAGYTPLPPNTSVQWQQILGKPSFGGAALLDVGTAAGTVAAGNDSRFGGGGGGGGAVASVFGRTGAVAAASGDYTASQVGLGNVTNDAQVKSSQVVTSVGSPGSDANVPSEKAVRSAIPSVPVASVFGRTGAVTAASGDYTFSQLSGAAGYSQLPALTYAFNFSATTYNTGTVDVTNGSNAIVGHGTTWTSGMTGMLFIPRLANCNRGYKFTYVDATDGTLESTYGTSSDSGHPCPTALGTEYQLSDIVAVPASTHQLGTADITIQCFDANTPRNRLDGFAFAAGPSVDPTTYAVQIVFWSAQAGRCILQR